MTERRTLTDSFLRSIQPNGVRSEVWDVGNPGFGVRVGSKGDISFQYLYRSSGKPRRYTLGKFPALSLRAARMEYQRAALLVSEGGDPASEQRTKRQAQRTALTVEALCHEFIERYAKLQKRTWQADARRLERDVIARLGKCALKEVTRRDLTKLLDVKMDEGAPISANRLQALLSKLFGWAVERGHLDVSPAAGMRKPAKETSRERVLQHQEIFPLWYELDTGAATGMHVVTRRALQVMLLTGQRKGEVLRMKWDDIEALDGRATWTIPPGSSKNGKSHRVPLSSNVVDLLMLLKVTLAALGISSTWCFPSPVKPLQHLSLTAPDHALREELKRSEGPFNALQQFTPHDFRRTVATGLSVLGYTRLIVQKVLNHVDTSVTSVYDRYNYDSEKREALSRWAEMLMAATWPAGHDFDRETGEELVFWDYQDEWSRMKY
ncbi:MAG: tyrosine-type recombinase/integrase [Janthinobacterium lividum]